jgi:hypothetical protein
MLKLTKRVMVVALAMMAVGTASANAQVYRASESWTVGPGDYILSSGVPGCGQNTIDPVAEAAKAVAAAYEGGVYGALASVLQSAAQSFRPQIAGAAGAALDAILGGDRYANCVPVSVVIPARAQIVGYQFEAADGTGSRICEIGQDCQIGWSRFDPPQFYGAGESQIVTSTFRNWSGDRTRSATMTVLFTVQ